VESKKDRPSEADDQCPTDYLANCVLQHEVSLYLDSSTDSSRFARMGQHDGSSVTAVAAKYVSAKPAELKAKWNCRSLEDFSIKSERMTVPGRVPSPKNPRTTLATLWQVRCLEVEKGSRIPSTNRAAMRHHAPPQSQHTYTTLRLAFNLE
jgi:hypothetical protein